MPLFEYRCSGCNSEFELLVRGSAVPTCPSCGSTSLERLLSMFAVSSEGTQQRSYKQLQARHKANNERVQKERSFYEHDDHHH